MTKKELHSHIGPKVVEMISDTTFAHILECAREEMTNVGAITDPTSIIRNEGYMQGWRGCIAFLKNIGKLKAEEAPKQQTQLYADPISENRPKL
jgi:hypothetical protein